MHLQLHLLVLVNLSHHTWCSRTDTTMATDDLPQVTNFLPQSRSAAPTPTGLREHRAMQGIEVQLLSYQQLNTTLSTSSNQRVGACRGG